MDSWWCVFLLYRYSSTRCLLTNTVHTCRKVITCYTKRRAAAERPATPTTETTMTRTRFTTTGTAPHVTPVTTSTDITRLVLDQLDLPESSPTSGTLTAGELLTRTDRALTITAADTSPIIGGLVHTRLRDLRRLAIQGAAANATIIWSEVPHDCTQTQHLAGAL